MLFEIITGDLPYHGRHLLSHHQRSPIPEIVMRPEVDIPRGIIPIVQRLLEKAPHRRFLSVSTLRRALEELGVGEPMPLGMPPTSVMSLEDEYPEEAATLQPLSGPSGPGLFHIRQPELVGRDAAKQALLTAAEAVLDDRGPRIVLLEGEAGLGKSYLAAWLRSRLEESGRMRTLVIRSEPQSHSGGGLRQSILRLLGAPNADREKAAEVFADEFSDPEMRERSARAVVGFTHLGPGDAHIKDAADPFKRSLVKPLSCCGLMIRSGLRRVRSSG